jgi:hypothetical protein
LWEKSFGKMREQVFDRSKKMVMGKLRNLLREFKKGKHQNRGSQLVKISYFKEIDGALRERSKNV